MIEARKNRQGVNSTMGSQGQGFQQVTESEKFATDKVQTWLRGQPTNAYLDPKALGTQYPDVDAIFLSRAITNLINTGQLEVICRVVSQDTVLTEGSFELASKWLGDHRVESAGSDLVTLLRVR